MKVPRMFPLGSSGGPDGITPQHIRDLLAGSTDDSLQQPLADFLNLMLAGAFDREMSSIIFFGGGTTNRCIKERRWRPTHLRGLHFEQVCSQMCKQPCHQQAKPGTAATAVGCRSLRWG